MSIDNAIRNRALLLERIGKLALNTKYPKEFEVYICALELVDERGRSLRYFIFPVNPSSLQEKEPKITNVKKTLSGVTALSTPTFVPGQISLSGTFGRKFKVLLGTDYVDLASSFRTVDGRITGRSVREGLESFDERIKTGYGCYQILKEIVQEADVVDESGIRRLIFYNPAFGTAYYVKPLDLTTNMTQESNMLHNYNLSLMSIAPLEALRTFDERESEAERLNASSYVQGQVNRLVNGIASIL